MGGGIVCYADGSNDDHGKCRALSLNGTILEMFEAVDVNVAATSEISVAGMSDSAAVMCYMEGVDKIGMCNGVILNHGEEIVVGEVFTIAEGTFSAAQPCEWETCYGFLSVAAFLSPLNMHGLACYAGLGGDEDGRCSKLSVPAPTTTVTLTTVSETSSTTPHTTTETSSTTKTTSATSVTTTGTTFTTGTTTSETSSSTPHTTTETETSTSETTTTESSGAAVPAEAAAAIAMVCLVSLIASA